MTQPFLTPWRLRVYPRVVLAAMGLALAVALAGGQGARLVSGRLGGDFAEFYAAGRIVRAGEAAHLYDPARQRAAQADIMPDAAGAFVPFAYPPQFALPYALLAGLPYRLAFALQLVLSAGLLYAAVALACRESTRLAPYILAVFCAGLLFYPLLRAVLGGQNTALTAWLMATAWALERRGQPVWAGLCLAALCYKPQFGLGLLGLYFLAGRWRVAVSGIAGLALVWAVNTLVCGPDWAGTWLAYAGWVVTTALGMEGEKAVSFLGVCRRILEGKPELAALLGHSLALATAGALGLAFWRRRRGTIGLAHLGLAGAGLVLLAPHAYYYDAGLILFAALALVADAHPRATGMAAGLWLAGLAQAGAAAWGVSPLFPALLAAFGLLLPAACTRDMT